MTMVEIPLCSPASTPRLNGERYKPPEISMIRFRDFRPQRKHICAALAVAILLISVGVCGGLIFVKIFGHKHVEDTEFLNRDQSWQRSCDNRCLKEFDVPPLLLISLDGFRVEYLKREVTPAISRIFQCGASSLMYPSFPSKTFPNHLSIVTGLYPESHGIVGSHFMDFNISDVAFTPRTFDSMWFKGEPIWNTALNNGKKSATFFWPGSEVLINGGKPTFGVQFNTSIDFSKRVDQVIEWLELPPEQRPYFLGMYFEQPDSSGHNNGTSSDQVKSSLIYIDSMVNYLLSRLDRKGYLGCINVLLVSDHGMQNLHADNAILTDYFNLSDPNLISYGGVISNIFYKNKSLVDIDKVTKPLKCQKGQLYYLHTPKSVPKRYHYSGTSRVGDIILESSVGHIVYKTKQEAEKSHLKADHGYDFIQPHMKAIFAAYGPSIKNGIEIMPFQNIELYNLFVDLMQLPFSAPNNGTKGVLYQLLKNPPDYEQTPTLDLPNCFGATLVKCGSGCHFTIQTEPQDNNGCIRLERVHVPESLTEGKSYCIITMCNSTVVFDRGLNQAKYVESLLFSNIPNIDHRASCTYHLKFATKPKNQEHGDEIQLPDHHLVQKPTIPLESNCSGMTNTVNASWISLFSDNDYARYVAEAQILAPRTFVNGVYKEFLKLLQKYRRHYKQLVMFAGPIFDTNLDGLRDSDQQIIEAGNQPTHVFFILIRCKGGEWHKSNRHCQKPEHTRLMSFILPLLDEDINCLYPMEYILRHSSRVRDIELLTGIEFFLDRSVYSPELAIQLRTQHVETLWQMEVKP